MIIFPAIDMYEKKAVRLHKGDYDKMTVYSDDPIAVAEDFAKSGASHIHMVDLEGARDGNTPNISIVQDIVSSTNLFVQIGGGIRSMDAIDRYIDIGVGRVILGTAAVSDSDMLEIAIKKHGEKIAVSADVKDGYVAIKGWLEKSALTLNEFLASMQRVGVRTIICTDISRDGDMGGTNTELYRELMHKYDMNIIASGGVSSMDDVKRLRDMGMYGAIIGKAYYTGAINLREAIEVSL